MNLRNAKTEIAKIQDAAFLLEDEEPVKARILEHSIKAWRNLK